MATYYIAGIVKEDDGSGYSVYFPDVPYVCASGTSIPEAVENASEGLYLALRGLAEDRQDAPTPSDMESAPAHACQFCIIIDFLKNAFRNGDIDANWHHINCWSLDILVNRVFWVRQFINLPDFSNFGFYGFHI